MPQIFVSYSRSDSAFVEIFIRRLQRAFPELKIWYDQAPHGLIGGGNWWNDILQSIAASDVFIYILSNESVNSIYCQAEFTEARRLQKRIITVQARDHTELTDGLDDIQFVDMKPGIDEADAMARLVAAVNLRMKEAEKYRHTRPLWKPATPKPPKETPPIRAADAPAVDTPPLLRSTAEIQALIISRRTFYLQAIIGVVTVIVMLAAAFIGLLPWLTERAESAEVTQTAEAAQIITQVAGAIPTTNSPGTQQQMDETEAADAALMALTPTNTPTMTFTPDPLESALSTARNFTGSNTDWQALYPNGFQHRFEDGVPMVLVPAGNFTIGANPKEDNEQNGSLIRFDVPFWIDLTEVTQVDFERLGGVKVTPNLFDGNQRPVEMITWFEAHNFCELRRARLPTEAEWEYAARGPAEWEYPWGYTWNASAVWNYSSGLSTAEVGSIPKGRSWVGAFDLSGNVGEWVSSLYLSYDSQSNREADTGSRTDLQRIVRGGSWNRTDRTHLRTAFRSPSTPNSPFNGVGFRCARSS